jgi:hypothetical protein
MVGWWVKISWKGFGKKGSLHNRGTISAFAWRNWEKRQKSSVAIARVPTGIRIERLRLGFCPNSIVTRVMTFSVHKILWGFISCDLCNRCNTLWRSFFFLASDRKNLFKGLRKIREKPRLHRRILFIVDKFSYNISFPAAHEPMEEFWACLHSRT